MKPEHFIGLDIGTSAVRCVVGMFDPNGSNGLSVIGHGSAPNLGMRRGAVVHVDDVAQAIVKAVTEAERLSGVPIKRATINVNGAHVEGVNSQGVIAISSANREITPEDRARVEEAAMIFNLPSNREIVQYFTKNYSLDGQKNIKDPVGMQGVRLEVDTHIVTGSTPNMRNLDMALEKAELEKDNYTVSGLAAAEAVMTRQQKEAGTALIDIGAGTTNLIVFEDGEPQHVAVLPIGGQHITNDLAIGLKTDLDVAEAVKLQHADLTGSSKKITAMVKSGDKTHNFPIETIELIVESRVEELLEYVDKELIKIKRSRKLPGGIVIVGGSSKLPGLEEFTREKLGLSARLGKLHNVSGLADTVEDASFTVVVGLMQLDMMMPPVNPDSKSAVQTIRGMLTSVLKRFGQ